MGKLRPNKQERLIKAISRLEETISNKLVLGD